MTFSKISAQPLQVSLAVFYMQVDNNLLYQGIENQVSPAYSFLFLSHFLSLFILNDAIIKKKKKKKSDFTEPC